MNSASPANKETFSHLRFPFGPLKHSLFPKDPSQSETAWGVLVRTAIWATAISLAIISLATADPAKAAVKKQTEIPAQQLDTALQQFMKDRELHIIYISEDVRDQRTPGAVGDLSAAEALTRLLGGTGLAFHYVDDSTITIVPLSTLGGRGRDEALPPLSTGQGQGQGINTEGEGKGKRFWSRFRLAQAASEGTVAPTPGGSTGDNSDLKKLMLEEIIVTAQKRSERLQDVPVPVTAINAEALVNSNQLRIQDYYNRIPGLSLAAGDLHGAPILAIRGVTTGGVTSPTVGITVDDVPFGSTTGIGAGHEAPDIDPSDLERVEVLRGPQGTLYGASSLGGLMKFVTVDPSTSDMSGRIQAGTSSVRNGDEMGYNVRGSINVPLSDTLAVRASGYTRLDPGYVDDPTLGIDGVNQTVASGGRLSALWRASDAFSLKLSALLQHTEADGSSQIHLLPGLTDLQQSAVRGSGVFDKKIQAYSATLNAKLGSSELTSLSGFNISKYSDVFDYPGLSFLSQPLFGVNGNVSIDELETEKFTQEVRLSIPILQRFEWLVGAFYNNESTSSVQNIRAADPSTGVLAGSGVFDTAPSKFTEYAVFTNLTFHVTDRFEIQVGGRESKNEQTYELFFVGPYVLPLLGQPSPYLQPEVETKDNSFTYLITPRFEVTPDLMVYARLASGYRPGGPNTFGPNVFGAPSHYNPDKTQNYEIGIKGDARGQTVSYDASIYYIDWKDIQLQVFENGAGFYTNASRARSQGIELSMESRPMPGLAIAAWAAWNDAQLSEDIPATGFARGEAGDRLPYSSRASGNLSIEQEFSLTSRATGFAGAAVSYVGDRRGVFPGNFSDAPPRQTFPSYTKTDLRAGVRYDTWTVDAFVNNVADKRGVLSGGSGTFYPYAFHYIQPRTIGISVTKSFGMP